MDKKIHSNVILASLEIDLVDTTGLKEITAEIQYPTQSFSSIRSDAMAVKEELTPQWLSDSYYCHIDAHVGQHPSGEDLIYEGYTLTIKTETSEDNVLSVLNDVILNE